MSQPDSIGFNDKNTTYEKTSNAVGPDRTVYAAWIEFGAGIRLKRKPAGGDWPTDPEKVLNTSEFISGVDMTVSSDNRIFIIWKANDGLLYYLVSSPGGGSWSGATLLSSKEDYGLAPQIASGPNGVVAAAFGTSNFHIYTLIWDGNAFSQTDLTPNVAGGEAYADPGVTIGPDGRVYVGYRYIKQESNGNKIARVYYSERKITGTWSSSKLAEGGTDVKGTVGISADEDNNLHVTWVNDKSGVWDLYYVIRDGNDQWSTIAQVSGLGAALLANPDVAGTSGSFAYGHTAYEYFYSRNEQVRYARFATAVSASGPRATPKLANGNPTTNQDPVSVSFESVQNDPTQLRWRWNSAPSDAANDSNGWQPYANPKLIDLPNNLDKNACQTLTLFTQVKNGTATQFDTSSDSVLYDGAVQANIRVANPFMAGLPKTSGVRPNDTYTQPNSGAYDGQENYTRVPQYFLGIYTNADCSGLSSYSVAVSNAGGSITNGTYENRLSLGQGSIPNPGSKANITVAVTDKLGNLLSQQRELIYDPADTDPSTTVTNTLGLPVLNDGSFTVEAANSIIRELTFSSVDVDDTTYGEFENLAAGKQFWGVWIANSRTQVNPNNANLQWFPVHVPNPGASFKVSWNIFNGIPAANRTTGTYFIYVKFLDGAGNATIGTLPVKQASLTQGYSVPTIYLPRISK